MDVSKYGSGFFVGLACVLVELVCDAQKFNDLPVGFDGDSHSVVFEDSAEGF